MTTSNKEEFQDTEEDTSRMELAQTIAEMTAKEEVAPEVKEEVTPEVKEEVAPEVKEEKAPEVKAEEVAKEEKAPENQLLTQDKAPVGWSPKMRERWGTLDPDVRAEVLRREEASALGVRQLQEQFAPANQFVGTLMPIIQEAMSNNVNPAQHITNVMEAERRLRVGTDQERFGALVEIADGYGLPLREILAEVLGKENVPQAQRRQELPPEIQMELQEARALKQQMAQKPAVVEDPPHIKEFAKANPYFEDVREIMADLAEAGFSNDLQALYNEAVWRNPGVREVVLEKQKSASDLTDKQRAAAAAKTKNSNTDVTNSSEHDDDDSLEDTIRKSIMASEGRV